MKKFALLALALCFSASSAWASEFKFIQAMQNPGANAALQEINKIGFDFNSTLLITRRTAARGRTEVQRREAAIKEALHRYGCQFFDESIDIGISVWQGKDVEKGVDNALTKDLEIEEYMGADIVALKQSLVKALQDKDLELWSGGASGNNTFGEVAAVYDKAHEELVIFGITNCGSDD